MIGMMMTTKETFTASVWWKILKGASVLCCLGASGSTHCRPPDHHHYHGSDDDDHDEEEEDGFDLCAIVIKDNIEVGHWLLTPL